MTRPPGSGGSVESWRQRHPSDHESTCRTPPHPSDAAQDVLSSLRSLVSHQGFHPSSCGVQRTLWCVPESGPLHLSKTRQQSNHQRSESSQSSGVDQSIQGPDVDPLLLQVSKTVDHLHLGPSQAVEFGDHQFISLLQRLQAGTQLVTFLQRCTGGHLLGEHLHASSTLQFIGLSSGVLVSGGTAGVPD